jgi:predicted SAM-dependent methyltransferase
LKHARTSICLSIYLSGVGVGLHRECLRVLRPGGVLACGGPDAGAMLRSFSGIGNDKWVASHPTLVLAVNAMFYSWGHHTMFDADLLVRLLRLVGFAVVEQREFGRSRIVLCPRDARRSESLYVEAIKVTYPPSSWATAC